MPVSLAQSFHCMYCHGWEEKGTPTAGVLAEGETSNARVALHLARQVLRMSDHVTLYTHGDGKLAREITEILQASSASCPMTVDARKITRFVKAAQGAQVAIHSANGTSKTEGFLAHKPGTQLRGDLAQQLGLGITAKGTVEVTAPFNQTCLRGVFAAGDCSSPMQTVTAAWYSGTCTGGGAPLQLQAEVLGQPAIF